MQGKSPRDLLHLLIFILFKRKWLAIGAFFACLFGIVFCVYFITPVYEATAKILVRMSPQQQIALFKDLAMPGMPNPKINQAENLVQVSSSRVIAETIVKEFELDKPKEPVELRDYPRYYIGKTKQNIKLALDRWGIKDYSPPNYLADAVEDLVEDGREVQLEQDTEVINLTVWGDTPEKASAMANRMAQLLVEKTRSMVQSGAAEGYDFALEQMGLADSSLRKAEENLSRFKDKGGISSLKEEKELTLRRLDELNAKYSLTKTDLHEASGKLQSLREQLKKQERSIVSSSANAANSISIELQNSLNSMSSKLAGLSTDRTELHPEVSELKAQIAEIKSRMEKEPKMIRQSEETVVNPIRQSMLQQIVDLESSVSALKAKSLGWQEEIGALQDRLTSLTDKEVENDRLVRDFEMHQERYSTLKSKLLELEVQRLTRLNDYDIKVVDPAYIPEDADPDYPDWAMVLLAGTAFSLFLALALPLFIEYWRDSVYSARDMEDALSVPTLGIVRANFGKRMSEEDLVRQLTGWS